MTPKQVALVQDSFAKVALSEAAAVLFYDRLFGTLCDMHRVQPNHLPSGMPQLRASLPE